VSVYPGHGENHPQAAHEIETDAATTRQKIAQSACGRPGAGKIRENTRNLLQAARATTLTRA